jgi:hypothetical protein
MSQAHVPNGRQVGPSSGLGHIPRYLLLAACGSGPSGSAPGADAGPPVSGGTMS